MEKEENQSSNVDQTAVNRIAQKLANNDPHIRSHTLKKLRRLLERSSDSHDELLSELNLLRLWKGLHYCMWMADKPLFQEELAERLAGLVHCFKEPERSLQFVKSFLIIEAKEWNLLDHFRLDKFMMLIRKVLVQSLHLLKDKEWETGLTEKFINIISEILTTDVFSSFEEHVLRVLRDGLYSLYDEKILRTEQWIQPFVELFRNKKKKLMPDQTTKKKKREKMITVAQCAKALKGAVTSKDVEEAAERMLQFENEHVINRSKNLKRKRKRDDDDDVLDVVDEDEDEISSEGDEMSVDLSENLSGEDSDEVSDDDMSDDEETSRKPLKKNANKKKPKEKNGKQKQVKRKTNKKPSKPKPKQTTNGRPKAADFF